MFPLLYHAHHTRYPEDLPFWLELAGRQGGPILELGCGTGRVLLPLAQAGYHVYGIDNDAGMLSVLRSNLYPALQPTVIYWQADLTAFHLGMQFSLILLPCNMLSTLPGTGRQAMLARVTQHLHPGGLFAASLPNPTLFYNLPPQAEAEIEDVFPHPLDGEPVQVSSAWKRTRQHFIVYWHYDHLLPDGRIQRTNAQVQHCLEPASTYLEELETAGFTNLEVYGDFDRSTYTDESPNLILVAGRQMH